MSEACLEFRVRLQLLEPALGGRSTGITTDYRPDWQLGNRWLGQPTLNGAQVLLNVGERLEPGQSIEARIRPLMPSAWGRVRLGQTLSMLEGKRVVGSATLLERVAPAWLTDDVATFIYEAEQYGDLVRSLGARPVAQRLRLVAERLHALHAAALALPEHPEAGGDVEPTEPGRPLPHAFFGAAESYFEVIDPLVGEESVTGLLTDDVLDIYVDVARGLSLLSKDPTAAVWHWRFHFDLHWGDHAADALRAIHYAMKRR